MNTRMNRIESDDPINPHYVRSLALSKRFFDQFDLDGSFRDCDLFSRMRQDLAECLHAENDGQEADAMPSGVSASEFFMRYEGIEKYITCHLADAMKTEMHVMCEDVVAYFDRLDEQKTDGSPGEPSRSDGDSEKASNAQLHVTIDGVAVDASSDDANLVEVAARAGIGIPAPCYRDNHRGGCCKGCVVEVDGSQAFACGTAPKDGMSIVVKRPDLVALARNGSLRTLPANRMGLTVAVPIRHLPAVAHRLTPVVAEFGFQTTLEYIRQGIHLVRAVRNHHPSSCPTNPSRCSRRTANPASTRILLSTSTILDLGILVCGHPYQCQKQPLTKTAVFAALKTRSGRSGRFLS